MNKTQINILTIFGCIGTFLNFNNSAYAVNDKSNLTIFATIAKNGEPIKSNISWIVFDSSKKNMQKHDKISLKNFNEVAHSTQWKPTFTLEPGDYYIQCSFGRISAIKNIHIMANNSLTTSINFNAGAIQMQAEIVNGTINTNKLHFSIFTDESENELTSLIDKISKPNITVPLKAGTYHLVSNYGDVNAIKRANIKVTAGDISQITFKHTAAQATLRLLRSANTQALADTKWSIKDASGDVIFSTNGAYATPILTHGNYTALAENKKHLYQKDFTIESGKNMTIDVFTSDVSHAKTNKSDVLVTD